MAEKIRYSASLVAAVEQCRRSPRLEFVQECDEVLEADGLLLRIREASISEALVPWFRVWAAIEREAVALRLYQPLVVPGLMQTPDYAHGKYDGGSPLSTDDLERIVAGRMARQAILDRPDPPLLVAVLDHNVLTRPVGTPKTMREQLFHPMEVAERPHVHVHVVPPDVGGYLGLGGPFVLATSLRGGDVAYLDNQLKGTAVDAPEEHATCDIRGRPCGRRRCRSGDPSR